MIALSVDDTLALHADQIAGYGGDGGVRDRGLLESAVAQPAATYDGHLLHADLAAAAAAYLFHIVKNHPFVDGNKRTGLATALVFLDLNGAEVAWTNDEAAELTEQVASSSVDKAQLTHALRRSLRAVGERIE